QAGVLGMHPGFNSAAGGLADLVPELNEEGMDVAVFGQVVVLAEVPLRRAHAGSAEAISSGSTPWASALEKFSSILTPLGSSRNSWNSPWSLTMRLRNSTLCFCRWAIMSRRPLQRKAMWSTTPLPWTASDCWPR